MKGLYLNIATADEAARRLETILDLPSHLVRHDGGPDLSVTLNVHPENWPEGPVWQGPDGRWAAASGWLVFDGKLGDLAGLAEAYFARLDAGDDPGALWSRLDGGAYVVLLAGGGRTELLADPFGLHPHFSAESDAGRPLRLAPSPYFLREGRQEDADRKRMLDGQGHLFGNLTAYPGIDRLQPGAFTGPSGPRSFFDYGRRGGGLEEVLERIATGLAPFANRMRVLPLSGGLDSRLLLAATRHSLGFTFGPAESGDRPVARRFAGEFDRYLEFSLLDLDYPRRLLEAGEILFDGLCPRPFLELLPVYRRVRQVSGAGAVFVDGYAGDVLQRGTYLTSGGAIGSLLKLLPGLRLRRLSPEPFLRQRYPHLGARGDALLFATYRRVTERVDLPLPWKLILFELVYGRGSRNALNGGTLMASSFFTPVQPFFLPGVFASFVAQDPHDTLSYQTLTRLWRTVPKRYAAARTYSGFDPRWNAHLSRTVMLGTKALSRIGLMRRARSYEIELPHVRWR